ncbi:hypothetical protein XAC3608_2030006 [Xanthomonas citri pv. citri]|nr:hypothetical protein XAC3608_2030006 [Xanthomonas citri pv. citri]
MGVLPRPESGLGRKFQSQLVQLLLRRLQRLDQMVESVIPVVGSHHLLRERFLEGGVGAVRAVHECHAVPEVLRRAVVEVRLEERGQRRVGLLLLLTDEADRRLQRRRAYGACDRLGGVGNRILIGHIKLLVRNLSLQPYSGL